MAAILDAGGGGLVNTHLQASLLGTMQTCLSIANEPIAKMGSGHPVPDLQGF